MTKKFILTKKFVTLCLVFAALVLSAQSKAHAVVRPLADVAINTPNNTTSLGTTVVGTAVTAQHNVTYDPNSIPQNAPPPAGATYTRSITSTEWSATPNGPWSASAPAATVVGEAKSSIGGVTTSFNKAGYYRIVLHVHVVWTPGTGDDTWVGDADKTFTQTQETIRGLAMRTKHLRKRWLAWIRFNIGSMRRPIGPMRLLA